MCHLRTTAKLFIPPILLDLKRGLQRRLKGGPVLPPLAFEGPLPSWQDAVARSEGWNSSAITEKTLSMASKVRDGIIEFEQDTLAREKIIYSDTILAFLVLTLARQKNRLDVVDFGGSLGTNFFQNRKILRNLGGIPFSWNIVERPVLADLGCRNFSTAELRFFTDIEQAAQSRADPIDAFLFSGSFQYLPDPPAFLDRLIAMGANILAFDRLLTSPALHHQPYIQRPDPEVYYRASYPVWCFSLTAFIENLTRKGFHLVEHFTPHPNATLNHCGMIFIRKD